MQETSALNLLCSLKNQEFGVAGGQLDSVSRRANIILESIFMLKASFYKTMLNGAI